MVERPGTYELRLQYTAPAAARGAVVTVTAGHETQQQIVPGGFDPPLKPSPDRIPRKEVYEKSWAWLPLGKLKLPAGTHRILLRAKSVPNGQVADIKALLLTAAGATAP